MRLFGSKPDEGETPEPTTSEPEVQPEETEDPDISHLYDPETGQSLNVDAEGRPCDEEGNIIPETMPGFEPVFTDPNPEPEPEKKPVQFSSPFETDLLSEDEKAQALEEMTPAAARYVELIALRAAERSITAQRQQQAAAADLGIDPNEYAYLTERAARVQHLVPREWKGSRNGAMAEMVLAALDEAVETGDFQKAVKRLTRTGVMLEQQPEPKQRQMIPASARMPNPRPSSGASQGRIRGVKDTIAQVFGNDEALAIMQKERRKSLG